MTANRDLFCTNNTLRLAPTALLGTSLAYTGGSNQ